MFGKNKRRLFFLASFFCIILANISNVNFSVSIILGQNRPDQIIQLLQSSDRDSKLYAAQRIALEPTPDRIRALLNETSFCQERGLRRELLEIVSRINADNFTSELIDVFSK